MKKALITGCAIGMLAWGCSPKKQKAEQALQEQEGKLTMLVGTYTSGESKGIYSYRFDEENGTATFLSEAEVENPSYLAVAPDGNTVYAVSELNDERAAVCAFAFEKEKGSFRPLNVQPTQGEDPCYIITNGKYAVTANYSGGSISVFPIAPDGSLLPAAEVLKLEGSGADPERQRKPHLHCVQFSPDGRLLFANDLGTDKIYKYEVDKNADANNGKPFLKEGTPAAFRVAAGSGPRHLTFAPGGEYAYLINELSGMVTVFGCRDGNLTELQSIAADTVGARGSADIHISPDGRFLYASNRLKADGMAIFRINPEDGRLTKAGYRLTGIHPRNFAITPNGKFVLVACRDSRAIQVYERDEESGLLTNTNKDIPVDRPVCIKFVP